MFGRSAIKPAVEIKMASANNARTLPAGNPKAYNSLQCNETLGAGDADKGTSSGCLASDMNHRFRG